MLLLAFRVFTYFRVNDEGMRRRIAIAFSFRDPSGKYFSLSRKCNKNWKSRKKKLSFRKVLCYFFLQFEIKIKDIYIFPYLISILGKINSFSYLISKSLDGEKMYKNLKIKSSGNSLRL